MKGRSLRKRLRSVKSVHAASEAGYSISMSLGSFATFLAHQEK